MAGAEGVLAGPWGPTIAIVCMALATYLCRIAGVVMMSFVRITPPIERALVALPGSIVAATVAPLAIKAGLPGILGVLTSLAAAKLLRNELAALILGLMVAAGSRALGL